MLRSLLSRSDSVYRRIVHVRQPVRKFVSHIPGSDGQSAEEQEAARAWLEQFNRTGIPRRICDVTFSRSSGPGGQKVNK